MECQDARRFIQGYLDGELQEAQAAPLRKHLLDCQPCRASAQSEKNLKRWFVQPRTVAVPRDFAARVARRAFAGDRGERFNEPVLLGGSVESRRLASVSGGAIASVRGEDRNMRFVLTLTSVAAAVLLMISMGIRSLSLPSGTNMRADDQHTMSIDEARQCLDQLNRSTTAPVPPAAHDAGAKEPADKKPADKEPGTEPTSEHRK